MPHLRKEQIIAGAITFVVAALLLLLLFFCGLRLDRSELAEASIPEEPDETLYIEPELLTDPGSTLEDTHDEQQPEPIPQGLPEKAETEVKEKVVKADNPQSNKSTEHLTTQKQPSPVSTTKPSQTDKEESKIASKMGSAFGAKNGSTDGKNGAAGSGGVGEGVSGKLNGRSFMGCTLPKVQLKEKYIVKVSVTVDESGKVIAATVSSAGGAGLDIQNKCVAAARTARWSEKPGAAEARGTLTFTLVPKI